MSYGLDFGDCTYAGLGFGGMLVPPDSAPKRSPRSEFVANGPYLYGPKQLHTLPDLVDELAANLGPRVYRAMMTDATVKSAVGSLRLGMLDGGISLTSPVKMPPQPERPAASKPTPTESPIGDSSGTETADPLTPEQAQASEVLGFCKRAVDRLGEGFLAELYALTAAMEYGVKLAEVTCEVPKDGPDAGRLVPKSFKVRPNWAWRFVCDAFTNVRGILTRDPDTGGFLVVDPGKFVWLSWMPEDSDPRGTSVLRAAYTAWNLKIQTWPQVYAHNSRFGSPGVDMEMAPGDLATRQPLDPVTGLERDDLPGVSPETYMGQALAFYKSGGSLVHPAGSKVGVFESQSDGSAMRSSIEMWDRQICLAIEYQTRVTMEAKHGSKADSQTAQDTKGLVNSYGRSALSGVVRGFLRNLVRDNFGDEAAASMTPLVSLGESDKHDLPALVTALSSAGYTVSQSQMQPLDAMIPGMPVRDPEADAKAAHDAMKLQQEFAPKPPESPIGDTRGASKDKAPKGKPGDAKP